MAHIEVRKTAEDDRRFRFEVAIAEGGTSTRHAVTLSREDYERLGLAWGSPEGFVRGSFEFLLGREPKESILSRFDITDIGRYFPSFEEDIRKSNR